MKSKLIKLINKLTDDEVTYVYELIKRLFFN